MMMILIISIAKGDKDRPRFSAQDQGLLSYFPLEQEIVHLFVHDDDTDDQYFQTEHG